VGKILKTMGISNFRILKPI